jgi:hypothetical protein
MPLANGLMHRKGRRIVEREAADNLAQQSAGMSALAERWLKEQEAHIHTITPVEVLCGDLALPRPLRSHAVTLRKCRA